MAIDYDALGKKVWHVGRWPGSSPGGGKPVPAFDIVRREDGGISLRNVHSLTDHERTRLMQHFGRPLDERTGGESDGVSWDGAITRTPGDVEHFVGAVHQLPLPFILLG
jgi:hypothetical protein